MNKKDKQQVEGMDEQEIQQDNKQEKESEQED